MKTYLLSTLIAFTFSLNALAAQSVPVRVKEGEQTFQGDLYLPKKRSQKPLPLVVVVHEWWGKTQYPKMRAEKVADELGFATLAVDLFGAGKTATNPQDAQGLATPFYNDPAQGVKRLQAFIAAAPEAAQGAKAAIDPKRIAAVGYCFGGAQALNLARSGQLPGNFKLDAVVAVHASLASKLKSQGKIEPKLLVLHGEADPMVKKEEVDAFKQEMKDAHADLKFVGYPDALHAFTNPRATEIGKKYNIPIAYNKSADTQSWKEMTRFLKDNLGK